MVRFCNNCKRAIDDLDKFCRSCGHDASDSIDYYTYYKSSVKEEIDQRALVWFLRGKDIATQQEIKDLNEKVDSMYLKLFPPSVEELREDLEELREDLDNFDKEEKIPIPEKFPEKKEEIKEEKKEEIKEEKFEKLPEKKEEIKEEKLEKLPEKTDEFLTKDDVERSKLESNSQTEKPLGIKVEKREDEEDWPWPEEVVEKEVSKEQAVPQEVNDKLNMLLQEDKGQRQVVQYLIDKYNKNRSKNVGGNVDNNKTDIKPSVTNGAYPSIPIVPKEDVVRIGRIRGKGKEKGEPYKMYDVAIHPFIPDILKSIENSNDGMIRVRLLDIARKMGEKFVDKKPVTIYTGLKYILFDHNIIVEMGSLKDVDPVTKENIKILKMRMKNPDDTLPPSMLERRRDME